ncbi:ribosome 60S biogenesis N-terminal-domain-containing protein [Mycena belliarum]|uniref:Ribosome 60S biogenesis N-terminal-domain-containing protein n=1 Tax=Mycena belliarum TaxID=1033014 RepID=A0AAD6UAS8_9AGAR|nr:ribosome 60S biogenesis N-terminal-domain-containing protein [Mycena belliae]
MAEPPTKRLKTGKAPRKFSTPDEIRSSLRSQIEADLVQALTELRNQFSVWPTEGPISPHDARLVLAQKWLDAAPGAHELFAIWERTQARQPAVIVLILSLLSSLLLLLSSHYTYHAAGHPILRTLLTPPWMKKLNSYLGGSHNEVLLVTLKLFNGMTAFGGGRERKSVLESFAWETKSLPKLLNMRRKSKGDDSVDPLAKPDIRTLYMFFCLSFLEQESPSQLKTLFLEQHREAFFSIFRGLAQDPFVVIRKVLEICWTGIWLDPKIKRTLKIGLFSEITVAQLLKLYERPIAEDGDPEHVPADLAHHFLLAICTRPGIGICFKDRGWYPRKSEIENVPDEDEPRSRDKGGKIYNKILANILKTLKVNEDSRQQELALKIMAACPELVAGFWSAAGLTLEPRLSSKWIANISFFGTVLSLPVPTDSFLISDSRILYHPTPPPLSVIVENILPSVNTKAHLSKGLLQASGLVQHCTALALCKCLAKYARVSQAFLSVETALEEDESDGQWAKMRRDLEREIRHRVPEFQVIVAFAAAQKDHQGGAAKVAPHPTKIALLAESAQRLLWMYHSCLPLVVAETRFDVGKLVQNFLELDPTLVESGSERDAPSRLNAVRQLHVLRLLNESDQFVWSGKTASSGKSHLHVLLGAFAACENPALRTTLKLLLVDLLSESIIFQQNQEEPVLWLSALPFTRRTYNDRYELSEGISLAEEAEIVIAFLDDCIQRCLKTPYRYIEDMQSLYRSETEQLGDELPGPLIVVVLEQLGAKMASKHTLLPSTVLALARFLRQLLLQLSGMQHGLTLIFQRQIANNIAEMLALEDVFSNCPAIFEAIRREVEIIRSCLPPTHTRRSASPERSSPSRIEEFLNKIGGQPIPGDKVKCTTAALEVVDAVRLYGARSTNEIRASAEIVTRLYPPALKALAESLDPDQKLLWDGLNISQDWERIRPHLAFDCLFVNSTIGDINDETRREILSDAVFTRVPTLQHMKRVACLISHSLSASLEIPELTNGLLLLLVSICRRAALALSSADYKKLKRSIFTHSFMVSLCTNIDLTDAVLQGLRRFVDLALDPTDAGDRQMASAITSHWLTFLMSSAGRVTHEVISPWIRYMAPDDMFGLLQIFGQENHGDLVLLEMVITALGTAVKTQFISDLHTRLHLLTALRSSLPKSVVLENMIATIVEACIPVALAGRSLRHADDISISPLLVQSAHAWSRRFHLAPESLDLRSLLFQEESWSQSTVKIISAILYQSGCSINVFSSWLASDLSARRSTSDLAQVLRAYLDAPTLRSDGDIQADAMAWIPYLSRFLGSVTDGIAPLTLREDCASCICLILARMPSSFPPFTVALEDQIRRLPNSSLTRELVTVGIWLAKHAVDAKPISSLIEHGLQWCIGAFATSDVDVAMQAVVDGLALLVEEARAATAHVAETLLSVIIQNRLADVSATALLSIILRTVPLKPLVVNRYLQSIVQHPHFYKVCAVEPHRTTSRDGVVDTLHILFNLHPANTCQVSHVQPLVRIYRGTSSSSDRKLLSIFQLFESQRKTSVVSLLSQWSATPEVPSSNALEAVQSLDAILVLRTCLHFPKWRCLVDQGDVAENPRDAQLYDPVFLVLVFAQAMAEKIPESAFGWIELFRTNIVGLIIRTLSAKDASLREVARSQLAALWAHLEIADMQEQPHVVYVLNILRNLLPPPSAGPVGRLPSYTTLILLHALRGIFYPSNFIYPLTARFLLQRPTLDVTDVPMLYGMLYSSSDDWKKEQGWIVRFIADGMMGTDDWRVLKRRHTWELLASLFQSSEQDLVMRCSILEVLANLTCNSQATTSLVLKSSLLQWIEMQLRISTAEAVAWIRIVENVLLVADAQKMESSTGGEWRFVICRCLSLVLQGAARSPKPEAVFACAAPVILRLSLLPGSSPLALPELLKRCLSGVSMFETSLDIPCSQLEVHVRSPSQLNLPPHNGQDLQVVGDYDPFLTWGKSVEYLWQASMTLSDKPSVWDALTLRLLIWRSAVGEEGTAAGEWARKLTLQSLRTPLT